MIQQIHWYALLDKNGYVCARFCPEEQILVIKRRGQETRWRLTKGCQRINDDMTANSDLNLSKDSVKLKAE